MRTSWYRPQRCRKRWLLRRARRRPPPNRLCRSRRNWSACDARGGHNGWAHGPLAAALHPPPAALVVHMPLHTGHDLFQILHDGVAGTAMAPFGGPMTDEEIWHTINYRKTSEP